MRQSAVGLRQSESLFPLNGWPWFSRMNRWPPFGLRSSRVWVQRPYRPGKEFDGVRARSQTRHFTLLCWPIAIAETNRRRPR